MAALDVDIEIEQGATFTLGFVYYEPTLDVDGNVVLDTDGNPVPGDPKDLTGCTARMQLRARVGDTEAIVTATSEAADSEDGFGGRITLGGNTGRVDIVLTDADTDLVTVKKGVYDLEIEYPIQSGELRPYVERVLMGAFTNTLNVTKVDT